MRHLFLDFETYSATDILSCGSYKYMEDTELLILLMAYAYDDEPVKQLDFEAPDFIPQSLIDALTDPDIVKHAWNTAFERNAIHTQWGIYSPPEQWVDDMIVASYNGLPRSLEAAGKAIGLAEDKQKLKTGKELIRWFSKPTPAGKRRLPSDHPEKWEKYKEYNRQDVETERAIHHMMSRQPPEAEHRLWCIDQRMNERGVRVDLQLAHHAVEFDERYKTDLTEQAIELTGIKNPNSVAQIKNYLKDKEGIEVDSLNKTVLPDVLSSLKTAEAKKFMALRIEMARSSTAKYKTMERCACADGHVRGVMGFYGARTGRWISQMLQMQNMTKNKDPDIDTARSLVKEGDYETTFLLYDSVSSTLSQLVRPTIIPEDGHRFLVADYSAIEARVVAWLSGEQWVLDAFRNGKDIYCETASMMFGVPVEKHGQNSELRAKGKISCLALGYNGGLGALKAMGGERMGLTDDEMVEIKDLWREKNPKTVQMWKAFENAAVKAVTRRTTVHSTIGPVAFEYADDILWCHLPSGRAIAYQQPRYTEVQDPHRYGKALSYMGLNQTTKKWERVPTFGGKLVENCIAEDTLVLTDFGWKPIQDITTLDNLWDGVGFYPHKGLIHKGTQDCIKVDGVWMTPEHKILTKGGWQDAATVLGTRLHGRKVWIPNCHRTRMATELTRRLAVDCTMRLWNYTRRCCARFEKGNKILWLYDKETYWRRQQKAWDVSSPRIRGLAFDEAKMHRGDPLRMEELWWAWNQSVRSMAEQFRELLGRHGSYVQNRAYPGQDRRKRRLLPRELPMDRLGNAGKQQAEQQIHQHSEGAYDGKAGVQRIWHRKHNDSVSDRTRMAGGTVIRETGLQKREVFDILDCGPRHRFTVLSSRGPILVHNCTQAIARDCLREAMFALEEEHYDMRFSVHDEIIITEPIDSGRTSKDVCEIMGRDLKWAPGLPLRAEGFEAPYYMKD